MLVKWVAKKQLLLECVARKSQWQRRAPAWMIILNANAESLSLIIFARTLFARLICGHVSCPSLTPRCARVHRPAELCWDFLKPFKPFRNFVPTPGYTDHFLFKKKHGCQEKDFFSRKATLQVPVLYTPVQLYSTGTSSYTVPVYGALEPKWPLRYSFTTTFFSAYEWRCYLCWGGNQVFLGG